MLLLERLIFLVQQRADWRLAFTSERLVGEELNKLMCEGCQVFHDFPVGGQETLSHIVVAPSGVYAIETLARRKRAGSPTQKAHEAIYDGGSIQFPEGCDTGAVQQAGKKAARLGEFLSDALKTPVKPRAILTLPGWYVITKTAGEVTVLNPKLVDLTILNSDSPEMLAEQLKQISRHLEKKCRDIEF